MKRLIVCVFALFLATEPAMAVGVVNSGFENGADGWMIETGKVGDDRGGANRVEFLREGAFEGRTCARLVHRSSWLWLTTSALPPSLRGKRIAVRIAVKWISGDDQISAGFTKFVKGTRRWAGSIDNLFLRRAPKDGRWHTFEFDLNVPNFDVEKQDIGVKFGVMGDAPSVLLLDDIRIVKSEGAQRSAAAIPSGGKARREWSSGPPAFFKRPDIPMAKRPSSGAAMEGSIGPVVVEVPKTIRPKLGWLTPLPVAMRNSGDQPTNVQIDLHAPAGVSITRRFFRIGRRAERRVNLDFRTLQPLDHEIALQFSVGDATLGFPIDVHPQRVFPIFGAVEHFDRNPPGWSRAQRDARMLFELPCAVYRIDCGWQRIEPVAGEPYRFQTIDRYAELIRKTGRSPILMMLGYAPQWAQPFDDPADGKKMAAYRRAMEAIVRRYAAVVDYWEAWNEPYGFWFKKQQTAWFEKGPAMLMAVQRIVWETVRRYDPDGRVLTPGWRAMAYHKGSDVWRMLDRLLGMGYQRYFDAVAVHNYPEHSPLIRRYKLDGKVVLPLDRWRRFDHEADMRDLLDLLDAHGVRKPLWATEFGGFDPRDERAQAMACLRNIAIMMAQRVEGALYYEMYDYPHDSHPPTFNLVWRKGPRPTLGFTAYQDMIRALTGAKFDPKAVTVRAPRFIEFRCFTRPGEKILLLWSNADEPVSVNLDWNGNIKEIDIVSWNPNNDDGKFRQMVRAIVVLSSLPLDPMEFLIMVAREKGWDHASAGGDR